MGDSPEARSLPSELNATENMLLVCQVSTASVSCLKAFHNVTCPIVPVARSIPSGLNATAPTSFIVSLKIAVLSKEETDHRVIVLLFAAAAASAPSGLERERLDTTHAATQGRDAAVGFNVPQPYRAISGTRN